MSNNTMEERIEQATKNNFRDAYIGLGIVALIIAGIAILKPFDNGTQTGSNTNSTVPKAGTPTQSAPSQTAAPTR
jgi:hypothetical protein